MKLLTSLAMLIVFIVWGGGSAAAATDEEPAVIECFSMSGFSLCERIFQDVIAPIVSLGSLALVEYDVMNPEHFERLELLLSANDLTFSAKPGVSISDRVLQGGVFATQIVYVVEIARATDPQLGVSPERRLPTDITGLGASAVMFAGLADGVNPCVFSINAVLFSSLALGGRRPRRIAAICLSFFVGVFTTYTALGFGVLGALRIVRGLPFQSTGASSAKVSRWIGSHMVASNIAMAVVFVLLAGVLAAQWRAA